MPPIKSITQLDDDTIQVTTTEDIDSQLYLSNLQEQLSQSSIRIEQLIANRDSYNPLIQIEQQLQKDLQSQVDAINNGTLKGLVING